MSGARQIAQRNSARTQVGSGPVCSSWLNQFQTCSKHAKVGLRRHICLTHRPITISAHFRSTRGCEQSQSVQEIKNDLGLKADDSEGAMARLRAQGIQAEGLSLADAAGDA